MRHLYVDAVDVQWQKVKMEHKGGFWILIQIRRFKIQFHLRDLKSKSKSKILWILWILQVQKSNPNNYVYCRRYWRARAGETTFRNSVVYDNYQ